MQVIHTFLSERFLGENYRGMSEAGWGRANQGCGFRLSLSTGVGVPWAWVIPQHGSSSLCTRLPVPHWFSAIYWMRIPSWVRWLSSFGDISFVKKGSCEQLAVNTQGSWKMGVLAWQRAFGQATNDVYSIVTLAPSGNRCLWWLSLLHSGTGPPGFCVHNFGNNL